MKLLGTASILALVATVAPVMALDIGGGFSLTGNLEYERLSTSGTDIGIGLLDADLNYLHSSGFGGFVGIDTFSASSMSAEVFYGALSYEGSFGKIQIGAPRNALDDYVNAPKLGGSDYLDLQLGAFSGSILPLILLGSTDTAMGLRYDGSFGAANVGVSVHDVEGATVVDAGMNYTLGQTKLMAGIEHVTDSGFSATAVLLGAEHDFGQVTAGAILGKTELAGDSRSVQAYVVYSPTDRLDLTASAVRVSSGSSATIYGLNVNYDLSDMVYAEAGYINSDNLFGNGDLYQISLGVDF